MFCSFIFVIMFISAENKLFKTLSHDTESILKSMLYGTDQRMCLLQHKIGKTFTTFEEAKAEFLLTIGNTSDSQQFNRPFNFQCNRHPQLTLFVSRTNQVLSLCPIPGVGQQAISKSRPWLLMVHWRYYIGRNTRSKHEQTSHSPFI